MEMTYTKFIRQEINNILTKLGGYLVKGSKGRHIVVIVARNDSNNLLGVNLQDRTANAIGGLIDGDNVSARRICHRVNIMHSSDTIVVSRIELDDDLVGYTGIGIHTSDATSKGYLSQIRDLDGLDDAPIDLAEEAIAHILSNYREVHIEIIYLSTVDSFAHHWRTIERHSAIDGMGIGQSIVELVARNSSCKQTYFERTTCGMFGFGSFG